MGRRLISRRYNCIFNPYPARYRLHAVLPHVSMGYPPSKGRSPTCYSPVRHSLKYRSTLYRATCMLKTRRQRSFWARIKLSIILKLPLNRVAHINYSTQKPVIQTFKLPHSLLIRLLHKLNESILTLITSHSPSLNISKTVTQKFASQAFE